MESGVQLSGSERMADASDGSLRGLSGPRTPSPPRRSSPGRGRSPRRGPSPACSDSSTLALIHSALHKRQLQVQVGGAPAPCRAAPESQDPLWATRGGVSVLGVEPGFQGRSPGLSVWEWSQNPEKRATESGRTHGSG